MTDVKIRWAVWSRGWMGDERQTVKVPDWEREGKSGSDEWDICRLLWWGVTVLGQSSPSRFYPACCSGGSQDVEKIGAAYWDNDMVYISDRRKLRALPLSRARWHSQPYQFQPPRPPPRHAYYTSLPCLLQQGLELANFLNIIICLVIWVCYLWLNLDRHPIMVMS